MSRILIYLEVQLKGASYFNLVPKALEPWQQWGKDFHSLEAVSYYKDFL